MAARVEGPTITRRRNVLACARCRARRVKCDRAQPACSNCSKANALCQPAQQQSSASGTSTKSSGVGRREPGDYARLSHLEQELGHTPREADSISPSRESSHTPSIDDTGERRGQAPRGNLIHGPEPTYFSPLSWAAIAEERADIEAMLATGPDGSGAFEFAPHGASANQDPRLSLPDDHLHEILLSVFRTGVDPLVRLLHWPSFLLQCQSFRQRMVSQPDGSSNAHHYRRDTGFDAARSGEYHVPSAVSAQGQPIHSRASRAVSDDQAFGGLLYSVYYAAVMSVVDSPNPPELGSGINAFNLVSSFKREIDIRVMALDVKPSIQLLQGLVLVLAVEPESFDVQSRCLQLAATISRARMLGVHRDGSNFDLGPIEIELRRRIWAQLCILDIRYAELLCREPIITSESYDTGLPLSIDDRDLADIEAHEAVARRGQETNFKSHQEVESAQERHSPFSPMSFTLVGAENARLVNRLIAVRYPARDVAFNGISGSPRGNQTVRRTHRTPSDKFHWVGKVDHRFQTVYGLSNVEASNPMQVLVSEVASISIAKAAFAIRVMEWKEDYSTMSERRKESDTTKLFHDAIGLATRTLSLIHQYSSSQYSWYTKRLRDVNTSAFLALNIASGQHVDQESISLGGSILAQLYPVDTTGRFLEHGLHQSTFGKMILNALKKKIHSQTSIRNLHDPSIQTVSGGGTNLFSTSMTIDAAMNLTTAVTDVGTFQTPGTIFGDFDTPMENSLWPSGLQGPENPYAAWV